MDGFLVIDKPAGMTSQGVVSRVKRLLSVRKAGHTGTLDPLATGVLPVALGKATRLIPFLDESIKVYQGEMQLGIETDTYDIQGAVVCRHKGRLNFSRAEIEQAFMCFTGTFLQVPPVYSALKHQGRPLYALARSGNPVVPPPREITVSSFVLLAVELPNVVFRVHCVRGTYVRSLVHDLGHYLGCGATLTGLRREQSGPFTLNQAIDLERLQDLGEPEGFPAMLSMSSVLGSMPSVTIADPGQLALVKTGSPLSVQEVEQNFEQPPGTFCQILDPVGRLLAIACLVLEDDHRKLRMKRVFWQ
ncbi:MAG: tRNA pseudouridine(55) synthase TruB [Deltaproteobacteria bacterium]|nr:tRNA pseudouridine(55) synthase TruB [Candidatus Anaeroferrophillus wilburensis]MBN2888924.1 tRNA pseudouridine(55) synthase TruB [Deltaproteobacteria bacterium]